MRSGYLDLRRRGDVMSKKVTEGRLERLEKSSTDDLAFTVYVSWSSSDYPRGDGLEGSADVIHLTWSEDDEVKL